MPTAQGSPERLSHNEARTKFELIDPVLRSKGYSDWRIDLELPAPVDNAGYKGKRRGDGRVDYLLSVRLLGMPAALPVGVIEAKPASADPLKGLQQAKD